MTEQYTLDALNALDDAAFNRVIAELDGWRIEKGGDDYDDDVWLVFAPDGSRYHVSADNIDQAWGMAQWGLYEDSGSLVEVDVPDYATDLNAAWGLPFPRSKTVQLEQLAETPGVGAYLTYVDGVILAWAYHANPARALATAWALWRQGQGDE